MLNSKGNFQRDSIIVISNDIGSIFMDVIVQSRFMVLVIMLISHDNCKEKKKKISFTIKS